MREQRVYKYHEGERMSEITNNKAGSERKWGQQESLNVGFCEI